MEMQSKERLLDGTKFRLLYLDIVVSRSADVKRLFGPDKSVRETAKEFDCSGVWMTVKGAGSAPIVQGGQGG